MCINYICTSSTDRQTDRQTDRDRERIYLLWASSSTGMAGFVLLFFSSRKEEK